jgi:glycerate 2-kinase
MILQPGQFTTYSLRQSPRGDDICRILASAIQSVDAGTSVRKAVSRDANILSVAGKKIHLERYKRIFFLGMGKAVLPMAIALGDILCQPLAGGILITKKGYPLDSGNFIQSMVSILEAAHPIPDETNLKASSRLISITHGFHSDDLVFCLVSGGGSALLMKPVSGISLQDLVRTTQLLLSCGAEIGEINTIRKHLDELKGGRLAKLVMPAKLITLILSDVLGDRMDQIASGPTVADPTTYQDALAILTKYHLLERVPVSVSSYLKAGVAGKHPDTIKPGDLVFRRAVNTIVGNNSQAVLAAAQAASTSGFTARVLDHALRGEASQVGRSFVERVTSSLASLHPSSSPFCFIAGGETTVTVTGTGRGGRNQELALGAVQSLSGERPMVLVSLATDGQDGPTDAAGAVVTNHTYQRGLSLGLNPAEFLSQNDSYRYFDLLGDLVRVGPTETNVNDLLFIFAL